MLITIERTGKAIRGPARDLLLSEATGKVGHGFGFGVHTVMDQTGACAGPLVDGGDRGAHGTFEYRHSRGWPCRRRSRCSRSSSRARCVRFGWNRRRRKSCRHCRRCSGRTSPPPALLAFGFVDFPVLGAHFEKNHIFAAPAIPLLYSLAMAMTGLTAFIFGRLFDRYGIAVLSYGIVISMLALPLGFLGGATAGILAVLCWASGLGVQDATLRAGIAQVVSMNKRGTAFGTFNGVYGVAWFLGSADHRRPVWILNRRRRRLRRDRANGGSRDVFQIAQAARRGGCGPVMR